LDCASRFLLLEPDALDGGQAGQGGQVNEADLDELYLDCRAPHGMAEQLRHLGVAVVICGGVSEVYEQRLKAAGLDLIGWVSGPVGEIIKAYCRGTLQPGQRCPQRRRRRGRAHTPGGS